MFMRDKQKAYIRETANLKKIKEIEAMAQQIESREKELEQNLTPEEQEKLFALLSNRDAVALCQICRLGTMKNTVLWVLGKKELKP
jgi:hypothetical protein